MMMGRDSPLVPRRAAPAHARTGFPPSWRVIPTTSFPDADQTVVDVDFVSCTS